MSASPADSYPGSGQESNRDSTAKASDAERNDDTLSDTKPSEEGITFEGGPSPLDSSADGTATQDPVASSPTSASTAIADEPVNQDDTVAGTELHYEQALATVEKTLEKFHGCSDEEKAQLRGDLAQMQSMHQKLVQGRVEIVVFGEISTGKSAMINALIGEAVAAVDVQGGWTRDVWHIPWDGSGYCAQGLADSQVVLVDTPGLNEVGGTERGDLAQEVARRADLILFVIDSDLNETEHSALLQLAAVNKPLIVVLNKMDIYSPPQRERLTQVIRDERLADFLQPENFVTTTADPREMEYMVESADGKTSSQWRKPPPDVEALKSRILEVLTEEGLALLALNAALYAADKSDRIAALRIQIRAVQANNTIWSYASVKSVAVAVNQIPVADVLGGTAVDVTMVLTLARIYGLNMTWSHAQQLVTSIAKAAGWLALGEFVTHTASWVFKVATFGWGTVVTAVPQGAVAGYGSYIVGQAAKHYFEHGASWGSEGPKGVVTEILKNTDKKSVLHRLKDEIRRKLRQNPHSTTPKEEK